MELIHSSFLFEVKIMSNLHELTKDELILLCRRKGLSEENVRIAVDLFYEQKPHKEIADSLGIDTKSVTMKKYRLKQKLCK
jgi:Bacterial regulatory proteins, luxR family.